MELPKYLQEKLEKYEEGQKLLADFMEGRINPSEIKEKIEALRKNNFFETFSGGKISRIEKMLVSGKSNQELMEKEFSYSEERLEWLKERILYFIKDETEKRGYVGGIVCLSGGLDSYLTTSLATNALGYNKVFGVTLESSEFMKEDLEAAQKCSERMKISSRQINVEGIINIYREFLPNLKWENPYYYLHLFQMITTNISLLLSREMNFGIISTGNKSEFLTGSFNLGGNVSDFFPLGELYKTQVRNLARYCKIPEDILNKPPRAGLKNIKTDEEDFDMKYELLDKIYFLLERQEPIESIAKICGVDTNKIEKLKEQSRNSHITLNFPRCNVRRDDEKTYTQAEKNIDEDKIKKLEKRIGELTSRNHTPSGYSSLYASGAYHSGETYRGGGG